RRLWAEPGFLIAGNGNVERISLLQSLPTVDVGGIGLVGNPAFLRGTKRSDILANRCLHWNGDHSYCRLLSGTESKGHAGVAVRDYSLCRSRFLYRLSLLEYVYGGKSLRTLSGKKRIQSRYHRQNRSATLSEESNRGHWTGDVQSSEERSFWFWWRCSYGIHPAVR